MILSLQALETSQLPNTTADLLDQGDPANIAIISPDGPVLTYGSLKCQVESLANQLNSFGIGRGDRVAIDLERARQGRVAHLLARGASLIERRAMLAARFRTQLGETQVAG